MQRTARSRRGAPDLGRGDRDHRCHECGEPIRGVEARAPGDHRFVGCGHRAGARFLESPASAGSTLVGLRVE